MYATLWSTASDGGDRNVDKSHWKRGSKPQSLRKVRCVDINDTKAVIELVARATRSEEVVEKRMRLVEPRTERRVSRELSRESV